MVMAALLYDLRDRRVEGAPEPGDGRRPTWMWDWNKVPENHYEMLDPYTGAEGDPVLLVTDWPDPRPILEKFGQAESLAAVSVTSFGRSKRLTVWRLTGHRGHCRPCPTSDPTARPSPDPAAPEQDRKSTRLNSSH